MSRPPRTALRRAVQPVVWDVSNQAHPHPGSHRLGLPSGLPRKTNRPRIRHLDLHRPQPHRCEFVAPAPRVRKELGHPSVFIHNAVDAPSIQRPCKSGVPGAEWLSVQAAKEGMLTGRLSLMGAIVSRVMSPLLPFLQSTQHAARCLWAQTPCY
jgi:hypothetical protein